jgi:mannose-1-phosphate guanylyltransferase
LVGEQVQTTRAFLLAGGRGERLRPLTFTTPKCLAPVNGTPILAIWLDLLERQGVTDVLLNISHHTDQVFAFLGSRSRGPQVHVVIEEQPVGNAGTVGRHATFVDGASSFWIFYADNLTNLRLAPMEAAHARHDGAMTMGLFHAPNPKAAGIVEMDATGRITGFVEKPEQPASDLANAGVYLARRDLLGHIPDRDGVVDFGHDVFPRLVGRLHGYVIDDFLMDIGTPTALAAASAAWARLGDVGTLA